MNLIYGDNAQGKTNLLEAVAYLSTARSHRARYDREMISLEWTGAFVRGEVAPGTGTSLWRPGSHRGARRQLWSNGVRLKNSRGAVRHFEYRAFLPGGPVSHPGGRRRPGAAFWTSAICQLRPRYAQALAEYNRLYEHKTRILRDWQENPSLLSTLDDFNLRMAQTGALLIHYRAHFIRRLQESGPRHPPGFFRREGRSSTCAMRPSPPSQTPWPASQNDPAPAAGAPAAPTGRRSWTAVSVCPAPIRTTWQWRSTGTRPRPTAPRGRPARRPSP